MLRRFPVLSVFDIAQTDPIEGFETPEHPARRLTGEDPDGIYEAMAEHMRGTGWAVTREPIAGETNGYTTTDGTRRIVVRSDLAPAQATKTMLREAGHALLHVDVEGTAETATYVEHQALFECEVESVAYVLAGLVGLDTSAYSVGYLATWARGDLDTVRATAATAATAATVLRAVAALAPALDQHEDDPTTRDTRRHQGRRGYGGRRGTPSEPGRAHAS